MCEQRNKSTTSLLECTDEDFRFVPKLETVVRRTSSLDDITRFYRYFHLVHRNLDQLFTWQQYLKIIQHQLKNLETITILGKDMLPFIQDESKSVSTSETSDYVVQPSDCVTAIQASLMEVEKASSMLHSALVNSVTPTQINKLSPMSMPQFEFVGLFQSSEIPEGEIEKVQPKLNNALVNSVTPTQIETLTPTSTSQLEFAGLSQSAEKFDGEIEKVEPKLLDSALINFVTPTHIKKSPPTCMPQFEFARLRQSAEKSEGVSTNSSTLSLMNRTQTMMKICSETKILAGKINKAADIISHLPHKCAECGTSLEGWKHEQNCIESIETGGDTTGNLEEDPIGSELSVSSPTSSFQLSTFSEKSSTGAGESTVLLTKTKVNPRRKGSIKLLAKLCKQWVTRK